MSAAPRGRQRRGPSPPATPTDDVGRTRTTRFGRLAGVWLAALAIAAPPPATLHAQTEPAVEIGEAELTAYARAYVEIGELRDHYQAELAKAGNKTDEAQHELRERLREEVRDVIESHGMTEAAYARISFIVSTRQEKRERFEEILERLAGEETAEGPGGGDQGG